MGNKAKVKEPLTAAERRAAERVDVEIRERGERVSGAGYLVKAPALFSLRSLPDPLRDVGVIYGAIVAELMAGAAPTTLGVLVQGGRHGGGNAMDRRLAMVDLRDRARAAMRGLEPMEPKRRARVAQGAFVPIGRRHPARVGSGVVEDLRRPIPARVLIDDLCIDGLGFATVLRRHGWVESRSSRVRLQDMASEALGAIACAWNGDERCVAGF